MSTVSPAPKRQKTASSNLTVQEIAEDVLTTLAQKHWSGEETVFSNDLVSQIYESELKSGQTPGPLSQRLALLEVSQYLERFLWPNFNAKESSNEHVLSIILLINQKFNERADPWPTLQSRPDVFAGFFSRVLTLDLQQLTAAERVGYVSFWTHCFQSLEKEAVRNHVLKLVSLPLWHNLSHGRLQIELKHQPGLVKRWNRLLKKEAKNTDKAAARHEVTFLVRLITLFLEKLDHVSPNNTDVQVEITFCERMLELLTDLLSQLPTRRFVRVLFQQKGIGVKCKLAKWTSHPTASRFRKLLELYEVYVEFNIDEHSGEPFTEEEYQSRHYEKLTQLQRLIYRYWNDKLHDYAMMDCASLQKRFALENLIKELSALEVKTLVVTQLKLASEEDKDWIEQIEFLKEVFVAHYEKRELQKEQIHAMALFPTEQLLWDLDQIPDPHIVSDTSLPMPKLNLQFLSLRDYLLRNFEIYRLEAAYAIQEELTDVLSRMGARRNEEEKVVFRGWARMATPITSFKIIEVQKPLLGYDKPASVRAEIVFSTKHMRKDVQSEWDGLKEHDVVFLIALDPPADDHIDADIIKELYGVVQVRGCEIIEIKDEQGKLMNDFTGRVTFHEKHLPIGTTRTLLVALDAAQYQSDVTAGVADPSFSLLVRRRPKENNFKSVLECVRDLMNEPPMELEWLQDVFLGYGNPAAAHYTQLAESQMLELDMTDTLIDSDHVRESFPDYEIIFQSDTPPSPPYRLKFSHLPGVECTTAEKTLTVESYAARNRMPLAQDQPQRNTIRFTPVQVEAVVSGLQKGLTMIVGPPGTGKTDTAVQILHTLYHNYPNQRTLLITHSNHALNDLFQKLMTRDVPVRYLLRLGIGEQELDTDLDFSRLGRVDAMLARRIALLQEVQTLAKQLNVSEDMAYSCETAGHFWLLHILPRWDTFLTQCKKEASNTRVQEYFPFAEYFSSTPQPLFKAESFEQDMDVATDCFRHLKTIFQELEECRAFELLKTQKDRINYLLTRQAKIVAMTCTHAALKRKDFLSIRFQYDTVLMEESAQALEIETFLPWTLQKTDNNVHRLKRIVLIGDHHQLPPVVQHPAFQKECRLDQSLFCRLIRLGVPYLQLDAQGRCRATIAKLFNWRYASLRNLPSVVTEQPFLKSNAGFAWEYQFIDVADPDGIGESAPTPFFYQNLAEAEYVVRVYQYMRLLGYPSSKISILTSYNGQKHLIRDVLAKRCQAHLAFGNPHKVTTVDKYQGQQNDYVLLSLVRTRAIGHIRDVRRLVVATSRARLGLYVFGCASLFQNCFEMQPVFNQWAQRPMQLSLVKGEAYGHCNRTFQQETEATAISGLEQMDSLIKQMTVEWEQQFSGMNTEQR